MSAAITALWFTFLAYWLVAAVLTRRSFGGTWWKGAMLRAAIIVAVVMLLREWFRAHPYRVMMHAEPSGSLALAVFGVVVCALGVGFAIWARTHLGRNWGMPMSSREGQELVTSGPYAFVRHPIYTGILLAVIGTAIVRWSPLSALMVPVCGAYFYYAARFEERKMASEFPNAYPAYMNRTRMLVPFLF